MTLTDVARKVQTELNSATAPDRRLRVVEELSRTEDDWYYFVVAPVGNGWKAIELVDKFGEVERRIRDREHLQVLLVPASEN